MRLRVAKEPLRGLLHWTTIGLFTAAVVLLAYSGFIIADAWYLQKRAAAELEKARASASRAGESARPAMADAPVPGGLVGLVQMPRIGLSAMVVEGTSTLVLRRAVGHIARTGMPGRPGNIGIAGHRDTFFRPLKDARQDDVILLLTPGGEFRYRVVSTRVVPPTEVSVLNPSSTETLTLVTCYPFYFVGAAPERFIVQAERVK